MNDRTFYFAYGSNMSLERLRARVSSAELLSIASLTGHALKFHKPGFADGTGKCDAAYTGNVQDRVCGALYSIETEHLSVLDRVEGLGSGYDRKVVSVRTAAGEVLRAETYLATRFDPSLRPLDWYKEHVLRGARMIGLAPEYIALIEAIVADVDANEERRARELGIYGAGGPVATGSATR